MRRRTLGSLDFPPKPVTEGEQEVRDLFHKMTALTLFGEREGDQSATELFSNFAEPRLAGIHQMERDLLTTPVSDQYEAIHLNEKIAQYRDELTTLKSLDLDQSTSEARKNAILKILADEKEIRSLINTEKTGKEIPVLQLQESDLISEKLFSSVDQVDHEIDNHVSGPKNTRYETEFRGNFADAKENEVREMVSRLSGETLEKLRLANSPESAAVVSKINELNLFFKNYRDTDLSQANVIEVVKEKRKQYFALFTELQALIASYTGEEHKDTNDTSEAETPKEIKQQLRDQIEEMNKIKAEKAGVSVEREAMRSAEAAYLAAYKDFHKNKKIGDSEASSEQLSLLKKSYDEARLAYAITLEKSVQERMQARKKFDASKLSLEELQEKTGVHVNLEGLSEEEKEFEIQKIRDTYTTSMQERLIRGYNARVRFNEIIRPAAENKLTARTEGLGEREKGIFSKTFSWFGKQNQRLENAEFFGKKLGRNGARVVRAVGATTALGLTAGAAGAFATSSILAVGGWATLKLSRSLFSAFAGGAAGEGAASIYERFWGRTKVDEATSKLQSEGRDLDEITLESLQNVDDRREKLGKNASEAELEKRKVWIKVATAIGVGSVGSALFAEWNTLHEIVPTPNSASSSDPINFTHPKGEASHTPSSFVEPARTAPEVTSLSDNTNLEAGVAPGTLDVQTATVPDTVSTPVTAEVPISPTTHAPAPVEAGAATGLETISTPVTAKIHEGEGALKMFSDLKRNLRDQYPEGSDMPVNVKMILDNDPRVLAQKLGKFMLPDGSSRIMHVGDSIKVDSHGNVVFADHNPKIAPVSLVSHSGRLEATEVGGRFETQPIPAVAETTAATPEPVATTPTPAPVSVPPPAAAPVEANSGAVTTAQLNAEQLAKMNNGTINSSSSLPASGITLNAEALPVINFGTIDIQPVPVTLDDLAGQPSVNESAIADHVFKNSHGVEINIDKPALQAWKVPGTKLTLPVVYGGDDTARGAWAEKFLQNNPKFDYVLTTHTDPITKNTFLQMHKLGANGLAMPPIGGVYIPGENINVGQNLPLPNVDDFIKMK